MLISKSEVWTGEKYKMRERIKYLYLGSLALNLN